MEKINFEKRKNSHLALIIVVSFCLLLIVSFAFYWFELRPGEIRSQCSKEAQYKARINKYCVWDCEYDNFTYNDFYSVCLRDNGQ